MEQQKGFSYTYSAAENREVLSIRNKYLPKRENGLEELKRLDRLVQNSGIIESMCAGILGCLIFGTGLCFAMKFVGDMVWLGVLLGLIGMAVMIFAYPLYKKRFSKAKVQYTPRILELAEKLSGQN